jgi:hypothetical protein
MEADMSTTREVPNPDETVLRGAAKHVEPAGRGWSNHDETVLRCRALTTNHNQTVLRCRSLTANHNETVLAR